MKKMYAVSADVGCEPHGEKFVALRQTTNLGAEEVHEEIRITKDQIPVLIEWLIGFDELLTPGKNPIAARAKPITGRK
jgi:hypothetical protein